MSEGDGIEKYGDGFDPSNWKSPESTEPKVLPADPLERILLAQEETQAERNTEYQSEASARRERIESLSPVDFVRDELARWRQRHEGSEHVDTSSPFEAFQCLLALLIEQGNEWPPQKTQAVRRIMLHFLKRSFEFMTLEQRAFLQVIDKMDGFEEPGELSDEEKTLVDEMIKEIPKSKQDLPKFNS